MPLECVSLLAQGGWEEGNEDSPCSCSAMEQERRARAETSVTYCWSVKVSGLWLITGHHCPAASPAISKKIKTQNNNNKKVPVPSPARVKAPSK